MSTETDPLRALLVDAKSIDRGAIAKALSGIVSVDADSGRPVLLPGFRNLDSRRKVLAILLAQKAATLLEVTEDEVLANAAVVKASGLPGGTVAPSLKNLRELRLVAQDNAKAYYVPNAQVPNVVEFLIKEGTE